MFRAFAVGWAGCLSACGVASAPLLPPLELVLDGGSPRELVDVAGDLCVGEQPAFTGEAYLEVSESNSSKFDIFLQLDAAVTVRAAAAGVGSVSAWLLGAEDEVEAFEETDGLVGVSGDWQAVLPVSIASTDFEGCLGINMVFRTASGEGFCRFADDILIAVQIGRDGPQILDSHRSPDTGERKLPTCQ